VSATAPLSAEGLVRVNKLTCDSFRLSGATVQRLSEVDPELGSKRDRTEPHGSPAREAMLSFFLEWMKLHCVCVAHEAAQVPFVTGYSSGPGGATPSVLTSARSDMRQFHSPEDVL